MTRLLLSIFILCLLGLSACSARAATSDPALPPANSSDENVERDAILGQVRAAITARDFTALSAMEDNFRSSHARTPSGVWKLAVFHAGLQAYLAEGLQKEAGCEYRKQQFLRQWSAAAPGNPAPAITDAALLLEQAWCIRGPGYADSVADEAWPKFREGVAAASEALERRKRMASVDPEFYAVKVNLARAQGVSKADFRNILEEAIGREPDYHRTYFNAVWYYLPQWGGSYREVDEFARYAVDHTRNIERGGLYARIFWSLDQCGCKLIEQISDWATMKKSMRDVYGQYPVAWNGDYFSYLACRMKDREEGYRYIRAMHPEASGEISFDALFATCDSRGEL